jgi:hypothetical protein
MVKSTKQKGYALVGAILPLLLMSSCSKSNLGQQLDQNQGPQVGPQVGQEQQAAVSQKAQEMAKKKMALRQFIMSKGQTLGSHDASGLRGKTLIAGLDERTRAMDLAEYLVDNGRKMIRSVEKMDELNLKEGKLTESPWSDDYWAIVNGVLGYRYADPDIDPSGGWEPLLKFIESNPASSYIEKDKLDIISPSEKYDLLMGDTKGTLTKMMWEEGRPYFEDKGEVEGWMGICHGWAAASYMLPRPTKAIQVKSFDKKHTITFYPSELRALGSLLWAKFAGETRYIGGRCNDKNPARGEDGKVKNPDCFDTNPGTWHMAVVNQIGVSKRSMVMDATFDYEVWNHPIYSYSYTYFNPQTKKAAATLAEAVIPLADYSDDKFKAYRDPKVKNVVGVEMKVTYVVETRPDQSEVNGEENDYRTFKTYRYDLELNEKGEIIGGEWHQADHPDFLWTPTKEAKAETPFDQYLTNRWNPANGPVNKLWSRAAVEASKMGSPLARVVESLFEMSAK